jgi:uncharacterized membrane protein YdjX (TVP38/TMEM64 family)
MQTLASLFDQTVHILGPLSIVALRFAAALLAFVPSSPVSLAAGASYGLLSGTLFVMIGAEVGALAALFIGRKFGARFALNRRSIEALARTRLGGWLLEGEDSQRRLMLSVLYCRLLPGLNLDGLSYVAGLTPIATWRFCLATFLGLLPYTLFLVATGELMQRGLADDLLSPVLVLILLASLVPLVWKFIRSRCRSAPCRVACDSALT